MRFFVAEGEILLITSFCIALDLHCDSPRAQFVFGKMRRSVQFKEMTLEADIMALQTFIHIGRRSHIERQKKSSIFLVVTPSNATNQNQVDVKSLKQTEGIAFLRKLK